MSIDSRKVTSKWVKESPFIITAKEQLEKDAARIFWKNLIGQGWRRTQKIRQKKRARAANT